jgi:NAD(P)-dependent dehydrogenase (short-subunit alcohol dehydrogenase family)
MTTAIGPALFDAMGSKTALQRVAEPEEVSKVILFLLSQEASYINAAVSALAWASCLLL